MKLKVEGKLAIKNPSETQITSELSALTEEGATFAILDRSDQAYIQVGKSDQGYVLEYQEGSVKDHHSSERTDLTIDEVILAFRDYASGVDSWKDRHSWSQVRIGGTNREPSWVRTTSITGFILLIAVIGISAILGIIMMENRRSVLPVALITLGSYALVLISIPEFFEEHFPRRLRAVRARTAIFMAVVFTCFLIYQILR
jgi:hypothetical protein